MEVFVLDVEFHRSQICFDPNFPSMDGLEWLLEDPDDVVVYGLMVPEFGPNIGASQVWSKPSHRR